MRGSRKALVVPATWPNAAAMNAALAYVPPRLRRYYASAVANHTIGILVELQMLGLLLGRLAPSQLVPYPPRLRMDGLLRDGSVEYELDVKALLSSQWDRTLERVCAAARDEIQRRYPGLTGHFRIADQAGLIPTTPSDGVPSVDEEAALHAILAAFESLWKGAKPASPQRRISRLSGLIASIEPAKDLAVYVGWRVWDAAHTVDAFRDKITRALAGKPGQFTGTRPAIAVCVCVGDEGWPEFLRGEYGIAEELFAQHPHLALLVAIPYAIMPPYPGVLAWRDDPPAAGAGIVMPAETIERWRPVFSMPELGWTEAEMAQFDALEAHYRERARHEGGARRSKPAVHRSPSGSAPPGPPPTGDDVVQSGGDDE